MKWALLLLAVVFLAGCVETFPNYDFKSCSPGDSCVVVRAMGCCGCPEVINSKYEDIWYDRTVAECPGRMCELCPEIPTHIGCVNGVCGSTITNFEECIAAGYPIMESYPRQCNDGSRTYAEVIELSLEEATEIALASDCMEKGSLTDDVFYNDNSNTWWFEMEMKEEFKDDICNPACVVSVNQAEINWRCTGAISGQVQEVPQYAVD